MDNYNNNKNNNNNNNNNNKNGWFSSHQEIIQFQSSFTVIELQGIEKIDVIIGYHEVFLMAKMTPKTHAPTLNKTNWHELKNSKTIKNKIIDPIYEIKIWRSGRT